MSDRSKSPTVASAHPMEGNNKESSLESGRERVDGVQPEGPPDGGWEAWMTIGGSFCIQFCTYGYVSAFGVYQDYYTRDFLSNKTPSDISWIGSFQLFIQYIFGVLVGRLFDAGYFHYMIAAGSLLQVFSMFMLSLAHKGQYYQVFLPQAIGMGLGQAMLFIPSLSIIGQHFKRRRAFATGIAVSGASVGGIIWPIMLNQLSKRTEFRNGIRATAAVAAVCLLTANLCMKTRPLPKVGGVALPKPDFKAIFRDKAYLASIAGAWTCSLGIFFPYFYLQLYSVDKGIDRDLSFYALAIVNAGSVFGRILPNFFADRFGPYNLLIPCLVASSVLAFGIFGIHNFAGVAVFAALYGFWSGSYISLIPSLLNQLATHMGEIGTRMGLAFSFVSIALLIGSPIEGALLHPEGAGYVWYRSIIFCGVMIMCGAVGMSVSRYFFVKRGGGGDKGWRV